MFLAFVLIYLSCIAVFFSSKQQQISIKQLNKSAAWSIFVVGITAGIFILSQQQLVIVACLLALTNIMAIWILLVFSQRYFKPTLLKYLIGGIVFAALSSWFGG